MKLKILFLSLLFATAAASAQFSVETHDGDPIVDGQTLNFGGLGDPDGNLKFWVYNDNETDPINMRIEFVSAVNSDGHNMELCFGLCFTGIEIGQSYPINDVVSIEPGEHQISSGDHFLLVSGGQVMDFVFRYYQVDGAGTQVGDDVTFNFHYDPALGVSDQNKLNFTIQSTVVTDQMVLNVNEPLEMAVYDLQGRLVKSQKLEIGRQIINMANLNSQMYICKFQNKKGQSQTTKVIVQ